MVSTNPLPVELHSLDRNHLQSFKKNEKITNQKSRIQGLKIGQYAMAVLAVISSVALAVLFALPNPISGVLILATMVTAAIAAVATLALTIARDILFKKYKKDLKNEHATHYTNNQAEIIHFFRNSRLHTGPTTDTTAIKPSTSSKKEKTELEKKCELFEAQKNELNAKNKLITQQITLITEQKQELETNYNKLLSGSNIAEYVQEAQKLREQLDLNKVEQQKLIAQVKANLEVINEINAKLTTTKNELENLKFQHDALNKGYATLVQDKQTVDNQMKAFMTTSNNKDQEITALKQTLLEIRERTGKEITGLKKDLVQAETLYKAQVANHIEQNTANKEQAKNEMQKLQVEITAKEQDLAKRTQILNKQLQTFEKEKQEINQQAKSLQIKVTQYEEDLKRLNQEKIEANKQYTVIMDQSVRKDQEIGNLKEELTQKTDNLQIVSVQQTNLNMQIKRLKEEILSLKEAFNMKHAELEKAKETINNLNEDLNQYQGLESQYQDLKEQLRIKTEELDKLRNAANVTSKVLENSVNDPGSTVTAVRTDDESIQYQVGSPVGSPEKTKSAKKQ